MRIWILQTGEPLQIDKNALRPMRAINLSNELVKRGHEVTLWSSDFDHFSKTHRFGKSISIQYSDLLKIRLLASRGYRSNVGLSRLIDHMQLGFNLWKAIRNEPKPDLGFIGYPPIEPAWVMARYLKKLSVPTVLDVKDAWPDVLVRGFPKQLRSIAKFLLTPYFIVMKSTFKISTYLSSISPEFLAWALRIVPRDFMKFDKVNYLSGNVANLSMTDITDAERYWDSLGIFDDGKFRCVYIGSLTNSLNFARVFEAARDTGIEFVVAGSGASMKKFMDHAANLPNVIFPGWVSTAQASVLAKRSTLLIAPYDDLDDFEMSLPNKFMDSMMHGRPMITSLSGFSRWFVETQGVGRFYSNGVSGSLTTLLQNLSKNMSEVADMGIKAQQLFEETYSGKIVYGTLVDYLEEIVESDAQLGSQLSFGIMRKMLKKNVKDITSQAPKSCRMIQNFWGRDFYIFRMSI